MSNLTLEQFIKKYDGASIDYDGYYGAQCVDLFNYYNEDVVGAPRIGTPLTHGARDIWEVQSAARRAYYDEVSASAEPEPGDVLVYGEPHGRATVNGERMFYGHVAIYIGNGKVINQNAKQAYRTTIDPVMRVGLLGILRPKNFRVESESQNVPVKHKNTNKHTIVAGDTFWDLENVYNIEHGTLQKLNPTLDPRRLEIGSEIVVRGQEPAIQHDNPTYYTIRRGDTFWDLENAWQLEHGRLQQLNPELNPRTLQIGSKIRRS